MQIAAILARRARLVALLSGAASATGFAPLHFWPVTLGAFALLLWLIGESRDRRQAFWRGWLFGLGHFIVGLNWIAIAFTYQAAMPAWLGWVAVVLLSMFLACYPGLAGFAARWLGGSRPLPLTFALAGTWIVTEWLRSWVFSGFAWNPLGVVALEAGWAARLVGTYGLSGLALLLAGALLLALGRQWRASAIAATPPVALTLAGLLLFPAPPVDPDKAIPITVVQPNISQADKWEGGFRAENFARLADETVNTDAKGRRIVFWPEAAVPDYLEDGYPERYTYPFTAAQNRKRLASLIGSEDLLITGAVKLDFNKGGQLVGAANSVFALDADGTILGSYDKSHLVPFGEYLPLESVLSAIGLSRLVPGAIPFTPGPGASNIELDGIGTMGLQICYEIVFSGHVANRDERPDFIFNPSNDAWFGPWGPPQHLAQARLRAMEEGLPVIRSTPTGISAVIDADGRLRASLPMGKAGRIDSSLPPPAPPTPFVHLGNWAALGLALILLLITVALGRRDR